MASITRRGSVWRVRIRVRGETLNKTVDTEAEAIAWAETEERRILKGETAKQIQKMPADITVAALFDRYAKQVSTHKEGARWEEIRLAAIAPTLPGEARAVDGAMLAEWRDRRLLMVSGSSVNRELNLISAVFTHAMKEWRLPITVNPAHTINWPKKARPRKRRVSDAERDAIIKQLGWDTTQPPETTKHFVAWAFCLALESMMRLGEILRLTWQHVHLERKFCHLPKTKNGDPRDVPLSKKAVALFELIGRGPDHNHVVPVHGGTFGVYFRRATKDAGVADMHFHDTRREALTRMSKKITNIAELARASGHRGTASLMVYYQPDVTEIANKLDDD